MVYVSVSRHEDREGEAKSEYTKLHERYTDVSYLFFNAQSLQTVTSAQLSMSASNLW